MLTSDWSSDFIDLCFTKALFLMEVLTPISFEYQFVCQCVLPSEVAPSPTFMICGREMQFCLSNVCDGTFVCSVAIPAWIAVVSSGKKQRQSIQTKKNKKINKQHEERNKKKRNKIGWFEPTNHLKFTKDKSQLRTRWNVCTSILSTTQKKKKDVCSCILPFYWWHQSGSGVRAINSEWHSLISLLSVTHAQESIFGSLTRRLITGTFKLPLSFIVRTSRFGLDKGRVIHSLSGSWCFIGHKHDGTKDPKICIRTLPVHLDRHTDSWTSRQNSFVVSENNWKQGCLVHWLHFKKKKKKRAAWMLLEQTMVQP